ncbi:MAG TPA: hypothetical protein VHM67_02815 [Gemmatimonadaceae bacterium]|nr:hypothetical protein [Gemmatimonadaceae bacterium]
MAGPLGGFLAAWRLRRHAASYVRTLWREPDAADVAFLKSHEPNGDEDHARWELRYAWRAAALLAAQRDAVDDRTAVAVARALDAAFTHDPQVARDRVEIASRQFNERLAAYREVLTTREGTPLVPRLGLVLLTFLGRPTAATDPLALRAGTIISDALASANEALRREFGTVELPEDVAPSKAVAGR